MARVTPETLGLASRGNGCMAEYRRGKGAVFNAASCEWVAGLIARERPVEVVTRNLLLGACRNLHLFARGPVAFSTWPDPRGRDADRATPAEAALS
jgi:hypothetical protein